MPETDTTSQEALVRPERRHNIDDWFLDHIQHYLVL